MLLPRGNEYNIAVQNPSTAFSDTDLKICEAEIDPLGLPKPYSGGFVTTYHLYNHSKHWAVRCFTKYIPDIQQRYQAIGRFLERSADVFLVNATCLSQGIRINGKWYAIVKMQWLDGEPLNAYISNNIANPTTWLSCKFRGSMLNFQSIEYITTGRDPGNPISSPAKEREE